MKILFQLPLVLSLFSLSCTGDPVGPATNEEFYPLSIGDWWDETMVRYDSNRKPVWSGTYHHEVYGTGTGSDGILWYQMGDFQSYSKRPDGIWYVHGQSPDPHPATLVYKYPAHNGDRYGAYEVVSMNEIVRIDLGAFRSVLYRVHINEGERVCLDISVAPGIGRVLMNEISADTNGRLYVSAQWQLTAFHLQQ